MKVIVKDRDWKRLVMNENIDHDDVDELNEFLDDSEYVPMAIPILKKQVWIPIKDNLDPQGHRWIPIDEWMPLGSLYRFKDYKWISIEDQDDDEEDWVPFEDMDIYDDEGEYDDGGYEYE